MITVKLTKEGPLVYHGSSTGLSATTNWTVESDQTYANMGFNISSAGDVNGDGYSDVIVGILYYDNGQTDEGRAYAYHGSASGLSLIANWTTESDQSGAAYGVNVATAGALQISSPYPSPFTSPAVATFDTIRCT